MLKIYNLLNIIDGSSTGPTPPNINSDNPTSLSFLTLPANEWKTIEEWKYHYDLAQEAFMKALKLEDYTMKYTREIWTRLADKHGQVSNIKSAIAIYDLYHLEK